MQTGRIVNDLGSPHRDVVYRYGKGLRGCDEAMVDLFRGVVVLDPDGKAHPVPVVWATQERAVMALVGENVEQEGTVVNRVRLPAMAIYASGYNFNQGRYVYHRARDYATGVRADGAPSFRREAGDQRAVATTVFGVSRGIPVDVSYTLYVWSMFVEDMNQILEQVITKFSPMAYIRVRGVGLEIGVKLDSIANNIDVEPGDKNLRVVKFELNMTAETFIPQPIDRKKTVLSTRTEILDGLTEEESTRVLSMVEESFKEE